MTTTLTLVIPTINGREASLNRTMASYNRDTDIEYAVEVPHNFRSIGAAWVALLPTLTTDLAHLTTDDVTSESRWANAIRNEWDEHGGLAVPLMLRMPGATLESHGFHSVMHSHRTEVGWCGVPIVPRCCYAECAAALDDAGSPHYYSDNIICDVVRSRGHMLAALPSYRPGHWWEAGGANGSTFAAEGEAWRAWRARWWGSMEIPDQYAPLGTWENWAAQWRIGQHASR